MKIEIEKISNGYILSLNGLRTFCDVPEAICGLTSEWVLEECRRLDKPQADGAAQGSMAKMLAAQQSAFAAAAAGLDRTEFMSAARMMRIEDNPRSESAHWGDAFKHMVLDRLFGKPPVDIG